MKNSEKILLVVGGPTASGKTALAIELAKKYHTEIISFDSRQFYKEMNIGTAKPTKEELAQVKHHFIGNLSVKEEWTSGDFEKAAIPLLNELYKEKDVVIAVGGSGLYLHALLFGFDNLPERDENLREELQKGFDEKGIEFLQEKIKVLDPEYFKTGEIQNPHRLMRAIEVSTLSGQPYSSLKNQQTNKRIFIPKMVEIEMSREVLYERINKRVDEMIKNGLVAEVKSLLAFRNHNALKTVGYKEIFEHLDRQITLAEAIEKIKKNTRRYAKRQITWFKNQYGEVGKWDNV